MVNATHEDYTWHIERPEAGRTEEVQHQGQEHNTLDLPHPAEYYGGKGEGRGCRVWGRSVAGRDTGRRPGFINKLTACDCRPRSAALESGNESTNSSWCQV